MDRRNALRTILASCVAPLLTWLPWRRKPVAIEAVEVWSPIVNDGVEVHTVAAGEWSCPCRIEFDTWEDFCAGRPSRVVRLPEDPAAMCPRCKRFGLVPGDNYPWECHECGRLFHSDPRTRLQHG